MTFSLQLARHRRHRPPRSHRDRRGFTILELLTVMVVMGTVGRIAVPNVQNVVLGARAREVASGVAMMHLAAVEYMQDEGAWPADGYPGQVPAGLEVYLPDGFDLEGEGYLLDWENWRVPDGLPDDPSLGEVLAVSVVTEDEALGHAVTDALSGPLAHYVLDDRYTFVLTRR